MSDFKEITDLVRGLGDREWEGLHETVWERDPHGGFHEVVAFAPGDPMVETVLSDPDAWRHEHFEDRVRAGLRMKFIAAARRDVPLLLRLVDRLYREVETAHRLRDETLARINRPPGLGPR